MTDFQKWVQSILETKSEEVSEIEQKAIDFELKASDDEEEKNVISGYASTFNGDPDYVGDIVAPGAFTKTIAERGSEVKFLFGHDWNQLIGRVTELREDAHGLYFKAKISETARGKEILTLVKDKVLTKISLGYRTKEYKWDNENGVRTLIEVELFEISVVPVPANDRAVITGVKEQPVVLHEQEEKAGRVLSAKTERALREAFNALKAASDAMEKAQKEVSDVLALVNTEEDAEENNDIDEEKSKESGQQKKKDAEIMDLLLDMQSEMKKINSLA